MQPRTNLPPIPTIDEFTAVIDELRTNCADADLHHPEDVDKRRELIRQANKLAIKATALSNNGEIPEFLTLADRATTYALRLSDNLPH